MNIITNLWFFSSLKKCIFSNYFLEEKKGPEHLKRRHSPEAICNGSCKDALGRVGFRSEVVQYRTTLERDQGSDIAESKLSESISESISRHFKLGQVSTSIKDGQFEPQQVMTAITSKNRDTFNEKLPNQ